MINAHLVLVSLSVYTFDMSKAMLSRTDIVSMSMRASNACHRAKRWLRGFPDRHRHGVATPPKP
jgi:hypothetical protein